MKRVILVWLAVLFFTDMFAQTGAGGKSRISGKVIDSLSRRPLEYATISVFLNGEKKPLRVLPPTVRESLSWLMFRQVILPWWQNLLVTSHSLRKMF